MLMEKFASVMHQKNKRSKHWLVRQDELFKSMRWHSRGPKFTPERQMPR